MVEPGSKHVLMIAFHYPPEGGSSGVLRTLKFSKYLPDFGWQPTVVTAAASSYSSTDEGLLCQIPGSVEVIRAPCFDARRIFRVGQKHFGVNTVPDPFIGWLPFAVAAALRLVRRQKFDALYSTSPVPTAHLAAYACHGISGVPWIADFRDPWVEDVRYSGYSQSRFRLESWMESKVASTCTLMTTTTQMLKEEILASHPAIPDEKIEVLPNGYDEADFQALPLPADVSSDVLEIIHTGGVNPNYRNPTALLEAISRLTNGGAIPRDRIRLTFLGGGDYLQSPAFQRQIHELQLDGTVLVRPRVPYDESLRQIARATVLLILQGGYDTRHLIPAKLFEYLRSNRPVLALTDPGVTADVVREYEAGLVANIADVGAISASILSIYKQFSDGTLEVTIDRRRLEFNYERRQLTQRLAQLLCGIAVSPELPAE